MFLLADCAPWWLFRTWSSCDGNCQPRLGFQLTIPLQRPSALPPSSLILCTVSFYVTSTPPFFLSPRLKQVELFLARLLFCSTLSVIPTSLPSLPAEAYELLKENLYTRDDAVIGEAAGLAMGLVMLGTKSPTALENMVNVSYSFFVYYMLHALFFAFLSNCLQ